jgi:death-on-curing family protein
MLGPHWVHYIHDELIHKFWADTDAISSRGVKNRGLLESAVARPFQTVFGEDAYPSIAGKAAALFHSLIANHPFHDGNKRTAVVSLHHFLIANGFLTALSNQETYELAKRTASYRERGSTHEEIFREVEEVLAARTISFPQLKRASKEAASPDLYFRQLLSDVIALRRAIRRSSSNRLLSVQ